MIDNKEITLPSMEKIALLQLTPREVKLVLAWHTPGVSFQVFDEYTEPLKIFEDIERDGYIKPTQIAETIRIVKMYRKLCDAIKVTKAIAYATSNFRDAKNHYGFLEELEIASGFKLRLMNGDDEITSIYTGVVNTLDVSKGMIMSIEDDCTRLIWYARKTILHTAVISFGAETLATLFLDASSTPEEQCEAMYDFFRSKIRELDLPTDIDYDEVRFVGVGDVFESLGKISRRGKKYPLDMAHNYIVNKHDFDNVYNAVKVLDIDKRSKLKGISSKNAGAIASGLAIIRALRDEFDMPEISISTTGMYTGVLFNQCVPITAEKPIVDILLYSLEANINYYGNGLKNGAQVYALAMMLFRQLRVMHKLSRQHIRALKIASFMYDCGHRLRYQESKKDALYVILNTQLYGASHRDLVMAAFVAASQNSEDFNLAEWVKYKDIVEEDDLQAVRKLAVILRIAVGLDVTGKANVKEIVCDVLGDSVIMKTISDAQDIAFEVRCASEASGDFKKIYGKNLELL